MTARKSISHFTTNCDKWVNGNLQTARLRTALLPGHPVVLNAIPLAGFPGFGGELNFFVSF